MLVKSEQWTQRPARVGAPYLRWALLRGVVHDGTVRWYLVRDMTADPEQHRLDVPEVPSADELLASVKPITGRPVAETLVDLAMEQLPPADIRGA